MITLEQYYNGHEANYPPPSEVRTNAQVLVPAVNGLLSEYGSTPEVSSGWRPQEYNEKLRDKFDALVAKGEKPSFGKPAKRSKHITGCAVDFRDKTGKFGAWCLVNLARLAHWGLYLEHPEATPGWCHLQCRPPGSGNRVFRP